MGTTSQPTVTVPFDLTTLTVPANELALIPCLKCETPLNILQPDAGIPDQLLGACCGCGAWFAIWMKGDDNQAVVVHLSIMDLVREKLGAS
jgi:hypothetical protein